MSHPNPTLSASYTSPSNPTFSLSLPLPSSSLSSSNCSAAEPETPNQESFLSSLRAAIVSAQSTINKELTSRMEDDKVAAAADVTDGAERSLDEDKEEQNYGEEVQEEEEEGL